MKLEQENKALRRILGQILQLDVDARNSRDSMSFDDALEGRLNVRWQRLSTEARKILSQLPPLPS